MKRIAIVAALIAGLLMATPHADAAPSDTVARYGGSMSVCPGPAARVQAQNAMFCYGSLPIRAEGPYFANYVTNSQFCRELWVGGHPGPTECHSYWPFTNPTINAHLAPSTAFRAVPPSPELVTAQDKVQRLTERLARKQARIDRLVERLHR